MDAVKFALLGLATGTLYAMVAQGLVLVYRGSGLLNFAQTGFVMVGAYAAYELQQVGVPTWPSAVCAVVIGALLGSAVYLLVLRPMRRSSPITRVVATLGVLIVLYSIAVLRYDHDLRTIPSLFPTRQVHVAPDITIGLDRILYFVIGCALTAVLWGIYRFTGFGRVTTAVAQNELCAASLGHAPDRVAAINWAIGGGVAAFAGVLIAPITFLEPDTLAIQLLIFPVASALVAGFTSFPLTLLAALGIGIAQSELARYVEVSGIQTAAPFVVVITVLVLRGRSLPLRGTILDRLPKVGTGRIRPLPVMASYVAGTAIAFSASADWATALTVSLASAVLCLSVVVITGYAGQLSLAQFILGGVAALVAAHLAPEVPFLVALLIACIANAAIGLVVGLPALRTRGIALAIVTLGLAVSVYAVVLTNSDWTGGTTGLPVPSPSLFGWRMDPYLEGGRYAFFALTTLTLLSLAVANLRRGATGRKLLAVRSNERAAASVGVNVALLKTYAFMVSSTIAGIGGTILAFLQPNVVVSQFGVFSAIVLVSAVVVCGIGTPVGALIGALLLTGGVTTKLFGDWESLDRYLPLIGGVLLLLNLRLAPDGIVELNRRMIEPVTSRVDQLARRARERRRPQHDLPTRHETRTVTPRQLRLKNVSVAFGGVRALSNVSLDVAPGEVHGLIGPNGAGKTTLIDAITGFVPLSSGTIELDDVAITGWSARRRARRGLSRCFQSLELFDDLTVEENLAVAADHGSSWRYLTDFVLPGRVRLSSIAEQALLQFELDDLRSRQPDHIAFGQQKVVAIARAVAGSPSVLLLDEPAAGLDDHEADELGKLIGRLAREWGIGILLVEHKIDLVLSLCDRVTVLRNGEVLVSGDPAAVRADPLVAESYLGAAATLPTTVRA